MYLEIFYWLILFYLRFQIQLPNPVFEQIFVQNRSGDQEK
jgi:hypothetical protein